MKRSLVRALLGALLALVIVPLAAIPAHAAATYTLQGTVTGTNSGGTVVPLADVTLWIDDFGSGGEDQLPVYTDTDGTWSVTADDGLTGPGPWEIEGFCDDDQAPGCYDAYGDTYAPTSYGSNGSPTQVTVAPGTPATVNLQMQRWGTIQGTITNTDGTPVSIPLDWSGIYDGAGEITDQPSGPDANGHYTITHVRPGDDLNFNVADQSKTYSAFGISPFTVAQGPAVTTQDIVMNPWSQIKETVTDTSGNPLPGMIWNVWEQQTDGTWFDQEYGPRPLDAQGSYTLPTQVGHHYKICAYDTDYSGDYQPSVRYRTTCWPNATTEADAQVWTPTLASPTLDATVAMPVAGKSLTPATPWVSGAPHVGTTLTVDPGVWGPGDVSLSYQWVYEDEDGLGVTDFKFFKPIPGATSATYTPTADMTGKRIEVEVSGSRGGYADATISASAGKVGATRPTLTTPLIITGSTAVGSTLAASYTWDDQGSGGWSELGWAVDGVTQPGDADTLTITPAMAGKTISARLLVGDSERYDDSLSTDASVVADGVTAGTVAITGTPTVGQTLTAATSAWRPSTSVAFGYQWYADGAAIDGATNSTLKLAGAQGGHAITVKVTGTRSDSAVSATSDPTAKIATATMTPGTATITGTPTVGQSLTADPGTWTPDGAALTYQWSADNTAINGATTDTLSLTTAQLGKAITVTITGTADGYTTTHTTSSATAKIATATMTPGTATITGTPTVGQSLTADSGTWTPAGAALTYQWSADNTAINGATTDTLNLTTAQLGKTITVTITGTADGYTSATATSSATAKVAAAAITPPATGTTPPSTTPPSTTPPVTAAPYHVATPPLSGKAQVGKKLTAHASGLPAGAKVTYQWYRNGKKIKHAAKKKYKLTKKDNGKRITVKLTVSVPGAASTTTTSKKVKVKATKPA